MTHFGFAFGVITASVLGGAFVVDHHLKNTPDTTTRTTTTTTVAEAPALPAVDATKLADASAATQPPIESAVTMPEPSKPAKAPARVGTSRSAPAPSLPDNPVVNEVPSSTLTPTPTPAPAPEQQPEKSEPAPANGPQA